MFNLSSMSLFLGGFELFLDCIYPLPKQNVQGEDDEFVSKSTRCLIKVGAEIAKKIPHRHCAWTNMSSGAAGCCDSFDSFDV